MDVNRYWAILRCIDSPERGRDIRKIKPPLSKGERAWYEEMKKSHEEVKRKNPAAHFVPVNDIDFSAMIRDFDPDKEYAEEGEE